MQKSYLVAATIAAASVAWVISGQLETNASYSSIHPVTSPADKPEAVPPRAVRVADLTARPMVDAIVLNGRTEAAREVQLRAETSGRVEAVLVERGARVAANAPVLRIGIQERKTALAGVQALVAQRQIEYAAAQKLSAKGYQSTIKVAEAKSLLDAARAEQARIEQDLTKTTITAPFDGTVAERSAEVGSFLNIGDPVARLVDLDPLRVVGHATERQVASLTVGMLGRARLIDGQVLAGRISYVAPNADSATRTFRIELEIPNPDAQIKDGQTAQIRIAVRQRIAHVVPPSVLTLDDEGAMGVKHVDATGRVRFSPVEIVGESTDGIWVDGLPDPVRLIVTGQEYVVEDQPVRPIPVTGGES